VWTEFTASMRKGTRDHRQPGTPPRKVSRKTPGKKPLPVTWNKQHLLSCRSRVHPAELS